MATGFQYSSITVRDSIQKSKLICEGPPARYRLLTDKKNLDNDGSVRKWTFGEQDNNMQNKILLMVGETGTGKTTLINAMANHILGVKFTDEVWFEVTEEGGDNHMSDQLKSQTTTITVYEVFAQDKPICLTIIDTPGYGDTRGTEYDRQIAENLYKLFCNCGVKEIDAVCLVVKASDNRFSDRQQYILDAVLSLFGKDIENNIVIMVTHSDGIPPRGALNAIKQAGIPCRKDEDNEPEYYLFNNHQTEKRNKKYNRALQTAWEQTEQSLKDLFDSLKEQNRKSLEQTEEVLMEPESQERADAVMMTQNQSQKNLSLYTCMSPRKGPSVHWDHLRFSVQTSTHIMATGLQAESEVVRDVIKKSRLISSTSEDRPARYRLITTRTDLNENGSVRKWTFGQLNSNMQNKVLLMVGETGTGKTTLINAMANHILGVKFTHEVWFEIIEDGEDNLKSDQSQSQTSQITMYEVFAQDNPICLTIIDTPGYGDTSGTEHDKQIAENLYKLFHSDTGVKEIDAVCLIVKASINRLSDRQQYIFDSVLSLFSKDIENNIFIFITHSDGMPPDDALNAIKKAKIPCRKDEDNEPEYFLFNNHQTVKRRKQYNRALLTAWEQTEQSLNDFLTSLKDHNRKSLEQTESVLTESKRLEACINNLQNCVDFVESKEEELAQIQNVLEENQEKMKRNENFAFTITEYYKEKVPIENASWWDRKATTCSVCKENCHEYGCWSAWNAGWCYIMKNYHCTVCTGKCHYTKHVRENMKYVTRSKKKTMTFNELKEQYKNRNISKLDVKFDAASFENVRKNFECNKEQKKENIDVEKRLKKDIDKTEKEKADLMEEAYTAIRKLLKIALKPDSAFIFQAFDFLIPRAEDNGNQVLADNLRQLKTKITSESQERASAAMGYFNKLLNPFSIKK